MERGRVFGSSKDAIRQLSYSSGGGNCTCQTNVGIPFSAIGSPSPLLEHEQGTPASSAGALRLARDTAHKLGATGNVHCALTVIFVQMNHAMGASNKNSDGLYVKCSPEDIAASILTPKENAELVGYLKKSLRDLPSYDLPSHSYAETRVKERITSVITNIEEINALRAKVDGQPFRLPSVAAEPKYGVTGAEQTLGDLNLPHTMNCPESRAPVFFTTSNRVRYIPRIVVELRDSSSPNNKLSGH
jgi:hypothetical protein